MQSPFSGPGISIRLNEDSEGQTLSARGRGFRQRRRNRHGRGLRGELLLPTLPGYRSRSERFDEYVMDSAQQLHELRGPALNGVLFAVDEIPPGLEELVALRRPAPMGSYRPASDDEPATITVYRRVVEHACTSREELQDLVHDVVVERTADMLGIAPESLDPYYRRRV
ncbi:metallopeptidase family protein [Pseudarthrobacter sp. J1738]|uniref:metallopeptidase family protein n=1 Tax=Pseudarthrobacter sp. J1738 TaxID=3420446 RepID=UPI003D27C23C